MLLDIDGFEVSEVLEDTSSLEYSILLECRALLDAETLLEIISLLEKDGELDDDELGATEEVKDAGSLEDVTLLKVLFQDMVLDISRLLAAALLELDITELLVNIALVENGLLDVTKLLDATELLGRAELLNAAEVLDAPEPLDMAELLEDVLEEALLEVADVLDDELLHSSELFADK
jgi:hypothetical protein